jgi:glycosyltransferase involved in cell wall biosynthesis
MHRFGVAHEVLAVEPFYHSGSRSDDEHPTRWTRYFSVPGKFGLPLAGEFLAARIAQEAARNHRSMPFDLIHAHAALPCGHAAEILSRRLAIPFAVSVHGLDAFFTRQAGPVLGNWCAQIVQRVYRSARRVICISQKVREQVLQLAQANTSVVYNAVDANLFSPRSETESGPTVLSVGNLIPAKGHAFLLRAFARISCEFPDCTLEIIGDGPEHHSLAKLAVQLGIASRTHFHGRRSREFVAHAMQLCTVFALPSHYEGLGCVYLEAMSCAKPVIACSDQGIAELITHARNGMLAAPDDQAALEESLRMLLGSVALRQSIGRAARETILRHFTLEHYAEQMASIYWECVQ